MLLQLNSSGCSVGEGGSLDMLPAMKQCFITVQWEKLPLLVLADGDFCCSGKSIFSWKGLADSGCPPMCLELGIVQKHDKISYFDIRSLFMPLGGPLQALEVLPRLHVPELLDNGLAQVPPFGQCEVRLLWFFWIRFQWSPY